jgi:acyl-CoA thioester hydrolase
MEHRMSKHEFTHLFSLPVRWGDADVLGHINNVQFVRYLESGRIAYCEDVLGLKFEVGVTSGWILADLQCSYLEQVHYPAELDVFTRVSKIGNKSATILADIYLKGADKRALQSKAIMVWFDYEKQQTTTIPDDIKSKIAGFEKAVEGVTS